MYNTYHTTEIVFAISSSSALGFSDGRVSHTQSMQSYAVTVRAKRERNRKRRNLHDPNQTGRAVILADQLHIRRHIKSRISAKWANPSFARGPSMRNGLLVALSVAVALAAIVSVKSWPIMSVDELQSMIREVRIAILELGVNCNSSN